jgi:hypothetical protein
MTVDIGGVAISMERNTFAIPNGLVTNRELSLVLGSSKDHLQS